MRRACRRCSPEDDGAEVVGGAQGRWPACLACGLSTTTARGRRGGLGVSSLLWALCARAWPVLTGHRRAHDGLPASRVGVMLCVGKPKLENQRPSRGRAIVAAKIKQPALFFLLPPCLSARAPAWLMVAFPVLRLRMQLSNQRSRAKATWDKTFLHSQ